MDDDGRRIEVSWTLPDLVRAQIAAGRGLFTVLVVLGVVGLVSFLQGNSSIFWVLFPACVTGLLLGSLAWSWHRNPSLREPTTHSWDDRTLTTVAPSSSSSLELASVDGLRARGGFVLLRFGSATQLVAMPESAFTSPGQREDLLAAIRSASPGVGRRWRDRVPTWAVVGAAVLLVGGAAVWAGPRSDEVSEEQTQLAEAMARWAATGPDDYDLVYRIAYPQLGTVACDVKVRGGEVASWTGAGGADCIEPETMDGLLGYVDGALRDGPDAVEELDLVTSSGALVQFAVDEDGTPEGRWSVTVLELAAR